MVCTPRQKRLEFEQAGSEALILSLITGSCCMLRRAAGSGDLTLLRWIADDEDEKMKMVRI